MALTNAEKQRRFRERRRELAGRAVTATDSDAVILSKLMGALGRERLQEFARAMPGLLAESKPKAEKKARGLSLADNEQLAPGGKLKWYQPNPRWHRLRAQAMVPLSATPVTEFEAAKTDAHGNVAIVVVPNPHRDDVLQYEIYTKRPDGRFPVKFESLTGYCSDSGLLNESGSTARREQWREQGWTNATTIEEAKARAQRHFERRLAGLDVAPPEDTCSI